MSRKVLSTSTLPKTLADFGWSYTTAWAVMVAGAVSYFGATYTAGFLIATIGAKLTMLRGLVLELLGLLFFAKSPSALIYLLLNAGIGIGQGFLELTVNWSTAAWPSSSQAFSSSIVMPYVKILPQPYYISHHIKRVYLYSYVF